MQYVFVAICMIVAPRAATTPTILDPNVAGNVCVPCAEVEWTPCPCPDTVVEDPCGPCGEVKPWLSLPAGPTHAASWHSLGSQFGLGDEWTRGSTGLGRHDFGIGVSNLPGGGGGSLLGPTGPEGGTIPYFDSPADPLPRFDSSSAPPIPTANESLVPEPGSLVLWSGLAVIGAIAAWRRRRLA